MLTACVTPRDCRSARAAAAFRWWGFDLRSTLRACFLPLLHPSFGAALMDDVGLSCLASWCRSWEAAWRVGLMTSSPSISWGTPWRAWSAPMTSQSFRNASACSSASGRRSATRYHPPTLFLFLCAFKGEGSETRLVWTQMQCQNKTVLQEKITS